MKATNKFIKGIKRFFLNLSNFKIIFIVYALVTIIAASLLIAPISIQDNKYGNDVDFLKALFTSASAFSDTGLTMLPTAYTWTEFGQAIIAILILLGGIGIFALKAYLINIVIGKWMSLNTRSILEKERGSATLGNLKKTIRVSISVLFCMVILATFILTFLFYYETGDFSKEPTEFVKDPKGHWARSFQFAVFHSISALNNAGFDIISGNSLAPYYSVYSIQIIFIILLIFGGIGYPVIYDVYTFIKYKIKRRTDFRFSLFTKLSCVTYLVVFLIGLSIALIFELCSSNQHAIWNAQELGSKSDRIMAVFFHTISTRNAGFSTTNIRHFTEPTIILFSIMMFIGSAPSSTAGGMRTTTLAIICIAIWNKFRGINDVRIFKRKINEKTVISSFLVLIISIIIVTIACLISLTSLNTMWGNAPTMIKPSPNTSNVFSYVDVFFEVSSAFGTTGLSTGLTPYLNVGSQLFLTLVMFIGQLGVSSTILVWKSNKNFQDKINYIEEDVTIG